MRQLLNALGGTIMLVACAGGPPPVQPLPAGDSATLAKIKANGKIVLGTRESSPPMAYNVGGTYVGYHMDLCERVATRIGRQLGLGKLAVEHRPATFQTRVPLLETGAVDLDCGSTTNNEARQKQVAFSLTTFVTEVRMAVKSDSAINSVTQLKGKTVVHTGGTQALRYLRQHQGAAGTGFKEIAGKNHVDSFMLLETGQADAFVLDDNLLAGLIAGSKNPAGYRIAGEAVSVEPIALMLRKDDPVFKKAVDSQLAAMMKSGELAALYSKWFMQPVPPGNTSVNLPMSGTLKGLLAKPNDRPMESYVRQ